MRTLLYMLERFNPVSHVVVLAPFLLQKQKHIISLDHPFNYIVNNAASKHI